MDRVGLGAAIASRLRAEQESLRQQFGAPGRVSSCVLDDLLDAETGRAIYAAFPEPDTMMLRKSLRERKYVSAQMDECAPLLEEVVYAFQEPGVVDALGEVTGISDLMPDEHLYAGGVSLMARGHYLNPHVDNSHDKDRRAYRVLNLLYYVTPDWQPGDGGSLQLWDEGPRRPGVRTIPSLFNRLVVMGTTRRSWHSVSPVTSDGARCCVSNYYFAPRPLATRSNEVPGDYFHPTSFRGFPDEPIKDVVLRVDGSLRAAVRRIRKHGLTPTRHVYKRP